MRNENKDLVRPSRDGDQFHYIKAARLCLQLLRPGSELHAVTVEGAADGDLKGGEDVIDLALYWGGKDLSSAQRVSYRQFKHSTRHPEKEMTASGLIKTLKGYAVRHKELVLRFGEDDVKKRIVFEFETNRPVASSAKEAIKALCDADSQAIQSQSERYLRARLAPFTAHLQAFARSLKIIDRSDGYLSQRRQLQQDLKSYLPDADKDAPIQLKDLVARKATSEFEDNFSITRLDVLECLGTSEEELFPAPNLIEQIEKIVPREDAQRIADEIEESGGTLIIQADGGVGKSILTQQLQDYLPAGSRTVVYDCFGNGGYRSLSEYRHGARVGLVQVANELATAGLCDPLIPSNKSDDTAYARAFKSRVMQASQAISSHGSELLVLIFDAADNSEMASEEAGDGPSFIRPLLRESWPENVRIVATARPHRNNLLRPGPNTRIVDLAPFSLEETARNLRLHFPSAKDADTIEFHRLTSQNPRVQAAAISSGMSLAEVLSSLGQSPKTVDDTIAMLLEEAVSKVRDSPSQIEQDQIDSVCVALATLRPFVPLEIVGATAGVDVHLVRSIANDLQRPLLVRGDSIQFRDEPTETWFRQRFKPSGAELKSFAERLRPLANRSAYVAAVLPSVLLQAGDFEKLVDLALKGEALPIGDPITRRDVELQRLQFAIKAALRSKRYLDAAKLTFKAGGEAAADERQQQLLSRHTDLAARFLEADQVVDQVSRRQIRGGNWTGSEHAYEAALLSATPELAGDARAKLRLTYEWVGHWSRNRGKEDHHSETMEDEDIAEMLFAELNLHGPQSFADQLRRWRPREVSFRVGKIVVSRLIDAERMDEIDDLAHAAGNDIGLILAIALQLSEVGRFPPEGPVARITDLLASRHLKMRAESHFEQENQTLSAVSAIVSAAIFWRTHPRKDLANVLSQYLPKVPPRGLGGRFAYERGRRASYLRAYSLRSAIRSQDLTLSKLADAELRKKLRKKVSYDSDLEAFQKNIGVVLPWHSLLSQVKLGRVERANLSAEVESALAASRKAQGHYHRDESGTADEIALVWLQTLLLMSADDVTLEKFLEWVTERKEPLYTPTLDAIVRALALYGKTDPALKVARHSRELTLADRADAETLADNLVSLSRAVLPASEAEAKELFNEAIDSSGKIGSENVDRWDAFLHLATSATEGGISVPPETAYRFARAAELTYHHVVRDKHFDWDFTAQTLARLSPESAFAIFSRWADRRFPRLYQMLPEALDVLCGEREFDPRRALAMIPMNAYWELPNVLRRALDKEKELNGASLASAAKCNAVFWRYARFKSASSASWTEIAKVLCDRGFDAAAASERAEKQAQRERRERDKEHSTWKPTPPPEGTFWAPIFEGLSVETVGGLSEALERLKATGENFVTQVFFREAFSRTPPGREADVLNAISECPDIGRYELRAMLDCYPDRWQESLSARKSLQALLKAKFREECFSVSASRFYQLLPLDLASRKSGLKKEELVEEAVAAIGDLNVPTGAGSLFQLAGLLAILLCPSDAREALEFALDLLEELHDPSDGDGPWNEALRPPEKIEASVAGFLWSALACPEAARRWEAAHVVRNLCLLGDREVIAELVKLASGASVRAFHDGSLRFYDRHALQWLLIALARAAIESPEVVAAQRPFLERQAQRSNFHVLIRLFAARALLAIHEQGFGDLNADQIRALCRINETQKPKIRREPSQASRQRTVKAREFGKERFSFGLDFPKYFLHPLARPFRMYDAEIETEAEKIIRDDWGHADNGYWNSDERAKRQFFRHDWDSGRGSMGKADDLSFYLSYHATMELAGKLLESKPLYEHPDHDWGTFEEWVSERELALTDGHWLFDRRQIPPSECASLPDGKNEDWAKESDPAFLAELPYASTGQLVVHGYWTTYAGQRRQTVSVASALVSSDTADALVRALENTDDPHEYVLPEFESHSEIDHPKFTLSGWIAETGRHDGLDDLDPWAAGIPCREFVVAEPYRRQLELERLLGGQRWNTRKSDAKVISEVWSDGASNEDDRFNRGHRLLVNRTLVQDLSDGSDRKLILEVRVRRELSFGQYEYSKDDFKDDKASIKKIFLF